LRGLISRPYQCGKNCSIAAVSNGTEPYKICHSLPFFEQTLYFAHKRLQYGLAIYLPGMIYLAKTTSVKTIFLAKTTRIPRNLPWMKIQAIANSVCACNCLAREKLQPHLCPVLFIFSGHSYFIWQKQGDTFIAGAGVWNHGRYNVVTFLMKLNL
jgi:hypothetical protein